MVDTPGLIEGENSLSGNDLVAGVAEHSKELLIMQLAVGQTLLFVMPRSQERLFTPGTHEMFNVPGLAEGMNYSLFNRASVKKMVR